MKHLNELIVSSPRVIPRAMVYVNNYRNNMKGNNTNWTLQLLWNYFSELPYLSKFGISMDFIVFIYNYL